MKALKSLADDQVIEKGMHALHRVLGPAGTRRFITLTRPVREDSVNRHQKWQKTLKKDEFFDKVFGSDTK
jgi:hypothetical protein